MKLKERGAARGSGACWDDLLSCWRGDLLRGHAASKSSAVRGTRVPAPGYKTRQTTDTANHTPHSLSSHMFRASELIHFSSIPTCIHVGLKEVMAFWDSEFFHTISIIYDHIN